MQILLPPFEDKTAPLQGLTPDLPSLASPELADACRIVADKPVTTSRSKNTLSTLGTGGQAFDEVRAQRSLYGMPRAPTRSVYTGVLYEAAQPQPEDDVWIFSVLFGLTRVEDLIPACRLSVLVTLPQSGRFSAFWKRELVSLEGGNDAYADVRSAGYQVWSSSSNWWKIRVADATGRTISHRAKHYRGLLTRTPLDADSSNAVAVAEGVGRVSIEDGGTCFKTLTLAVE